MLHTHSKLWVSALAAFTLLGVTACNDKADAQEPAAAAQTAAAETQNKGPEAVKAAVTKDSPFEDKASYAFGASIGIYVATMQQTQADIVGPLDSDLILQGFTDALKGESTMDQQDIEQTLLALNQKAEEAMLAKIQAENQANLEAGQKFLEENKTKEGVVTTDSGLQYKVIKEGTGKKPAPDDIISVKYKGTDIHGAVFDEQTEPVDFPLGNMIPGWVEGLGLMSEGSVYELYIPASLAYGENGAGDIIKPNSVLVFNVELVEVKSSGDDAEAEGDEAAQDDAAAQESTEAADEAAAEESAE